MSDATPTKQQKKCTHVSSAWYGSLIHSLGRRVRCVLPSMVSNILPCVAEAIIHNTTPRSALDVLLSGRCTGVLLSKCPGEYYSRVAASSVSSIKLWAPRSTSDAILRTLSTSTSMTSLVIESPSLVVEDRTLTALSRCPSLASLTLPRYSHAMSSAAALATSTSLTSLDGMFKNSDLAAIGALPSLRRLCMRTSAEHPVTDDGLRGLAASAVLENVTIRSETLTPRSCTFFAMCPALRILDLSHAFSMTDSGLTALSASRTLTTLVLCRRQHHITDAGMTALSSLETLTSLHAPLCKEVTDAGLTALATRAQLTQLSIYGCVSVGDRGITAIAKCPLGTLDMSHCYQDTVTDASLSALASFTSTLRHLDIRSCCRCTDAGVARLASLPHLAQLSVCNAPSITKTGLRALPDVVFRCAEVW